MTGDRGRDDDQQYRGGSAGIASAKLPRGHRDDAVRAVRVDYRMGASPAPKAVKIRVGRPFRAGFTSGKSPIAR